MGVIAPGLVEPGNLELNGRPIIHNEDGTHSSEYSTSFGTDQGEVLVPTIVNGKFLTQDGRKPPVGSQAEKDMFAAARDHYRKTGEHLGIFDTPDNADTYAEEVHSRNLRSGITPADIQAAGGKTVVHPTIQKFQPLDLTPHVAAAGGRTIGSIVDGVYQSAKNLVTTGDVTGHPEATERNAEQELKNNDVQRAGEKEYSDWLYRTQPEEYKKANPADFYLRKAHDFLSDAVVEPSLRGMTGAERAKIEPQLRQVADVGLGAYGVPAGGSGVGRTAPVRVAGAILPPEAEGEGEGLTEEEVEATGGHTVQAAGEPEPVRVNPESFIKKISAPESKVNSKVVQAYRDDIRAGRPLRPAELHLDSAGNVIGADGRHRALAAKLEGVPELQVRVSRQVPQLAHERVLPSTATQNPQIQKVVEGAGGVYRGQNKDGLVEITLPESLTKNLPISEPLKKFVSVNLPADSITPEAVKAAMDRKIAEFGGSEDKLPFQEMGQKPAQKEFPLGSKGYHEQKYSTSVPVKVTWPVHPHMRPHFDEVKGLNEGHALARARQNWPGAVVEKITPSDAGLTDEDIAAAGGTTISRKAVGAK
jgi:hypothetical protein